MSEELCNAPDRYTPGSTGVPVEILVKNSLSLGLSTVTDLGSVTGWSLYLELTVAQSFRVD